MIVATAPIRPVATTIGYQADSLLSFDVSAISLAISALIFANSAWVISLVLIILPFGIRAAAFPLPHESKYSPNGAIGQHQKKDKNYIVLTNLSATGEDCLSDELFLHPYSRLLFGALQSN